MSDPNERSNSDTADRARKVAEVLRDADPEEVNEEMLDTTAEYLEEVARVAEAFEEQIELQEEQIELLNRQIEALGGDPDV